MPSLQQTWDTLLVKNKKRSYEDDGKEHLTAFDVENEERALSDLVETAPTQRPRLRYVVVLQFMIILLLLTIIVARIGENYGDVSGQVYTPAFEVSRIRESKSLDFRIFSDNPFRGKPGPNIDAAWNDLIKNAFIRLSPQELEKLGRTSVPIQDGSGDYVGSVGVYHQLHCINYIYQHAHPEYYTMNKTNIDVADHVDHCIDMLRQIIMCRADTAVMTASWRQGFPLAWLDNNAVHECGSWDAVDAWAGQKGRVVDQSDPKRFIRWISNPDFVRKYGYIDPDKVE